MVDEASQENRHWLIDVAESVGLMDLVLESDPPTSSIRAAWVEISHSAGISEEELAERVAKHFRLGTANLDAVEPMASKLLPENTARKYGLLPLRASGQIIVVATSDPVNIRAEHDIQFLSGREPVFQVAAPGPLMEAIDASYGRGKIVEFVLQNLAAEASRNEVEFDRGKRGGASTAPSRALPVANLVNRILRQAACVGATEVTVEPDVLGGQVMFRIDGLVEPFMSLPGPALIRVVHRLKELARLDTDVRVRPQEGQLSATVKGRPFLLRVRTEPESPVERVSVRITDPRAGLPLAGLGLPPCESEPLEQLLSRERGLVLLAAPAHSGLTHLMVACARAAVAKGRPVTVVDTRMDIRLEGAQQIQAEPDAGFSFSAAAARALEDDVGVLILPKIPDEETAKILLGAAASRALVIVGIEADTTAGSIGKLTELRVTRPQIAEALAGIVSHRLVRRLCPTCARDVADPSLIPASERALADAYGVNPTKLAAGCVSCRTTGFRGRLLLTSTTHASPELATMIAEGALGSEIERVAREGARTLLEAAAARVSRGQTLLQEIERVLPASKTPGEPLSGRRKILVVDDNSEIGLLMRTVLSTKGFEVAYVSDGAAALEHLDLHDDTALVILDLLMPGLSGQQVLERMRKNQRTATLPVVILTADENPAHEIQLLEAGADDYLTKPVDPGRLAVRVRAVLRRREGSPTGSTKPTPPQPALVAS